MSLRNTLPKEKCLTKLVGFQTLYRRVAEIGVQFGKLLQIQIIYSKFPKQQHVSCYNNKTCRINAVTAFPASDF